MSSTASARDRVPEPHPAFLEWPGIPGPVFNGTGDQLRHSAGTHPLSGIASICSEAEHGL